MNIREASKAKRIAAVLIVLCSISLLFHLQEILEIFIKGINYPLEVYIRPGASILSVCGVIVVYAFLEKPKPKGVVLALVIVETLRRIAFNATILLIRNNTNFFLEHKSLTAGAYNFLRSGCLIITIVMTAILIKKSCKQAKLVLVAYLLYAILSLAQGIQFFWLVGIIEVLRDVLLILSLTAAVIYAAREVRQTNTQLHHKEI